MAGAENGSQSGSPPHSSPARYLRALPECGVILCTEHQRCFTARSLPEHLKRSHGVLREQARQLRHWVAEQHLAEQVVTPPDHGPFIHGLQHREGFACNAVTCDYRVASEQNIQRHCSREHHVDVRKTQKERAMYTPVLLQYLFATNPRYFIVRPDLAAAAPTTSAAPIPPISTPLASSSQHERLSISTALAIRNQAIYDRRQDRYRQIGEPNHISEITPWLHKSQIHLHLNALDADLITASYSLPARPDFDSRLTHVTQSVDRILRRAHDSVADLYHVDARVLNTFRVDTMTQDPLQQLQNKQTLTAYIHAFQAAVCYFIRVTEGHFDRDMFIATADQQAALQRVLDIVAQLDEPMSESEQESDGSVDVGDADLGLDRHVLDLCLALIRHRVRKNFDSAIVSFCAVWAAHVYGAENAVTFRPEGEVSGLLSRLIYCCQLLILQEAHDVAERRQLEDIAEPLETMCREWVLNNSRGPVGVLGDWRLYTLRVGASTVPPALVVWDQDGRQLTYGDVRYGIDDLATEMLFSLRAARDVLYQELCFGFADIPTFPLRELQDNWATSLPGYSFVNDTRNAVYFEGCQHWLTARIAQDPACLNAVYHTEQHEHDARCSWPVRSEFARQYQTSDEKFLRYLLVAMHKGSGQPARRVEFVGIRWRNTGLGPRNLRLIFDYLCFILTYHKSQTRTHASRSPVRFVFPEVAQLVVQYLVLVQPFREMLSHETQIPAAVGDYLFSSDDRPWLDSRFSEILVSVSRQSLGRKVSTQKWRQICVAIAIKCFSGRAFETDIDTPGNDDDEIDSSMMNEGVVLSAAFHAQAAHSAFTGNRAYGGSVNFGSSLTDAGVQAYLRTSQLWWSLFQDAVRELPDRKRARPLSSAPALPLLVKRVAQRAQPPRHLRRWGSENVAIALQRLFRDPQARFRSDIQREMVETVAAGYSEVIIVLATGGGKSLAFMVPICLPQAATTVVILPLVVLKQDTVRRFLEIDLQHAVWDSHGDAERLSGVPVLFVGVEQAVREPFRRFLGRLEANQQLDRVVFEEAQLVITSASYRPKMALLRYLRELRCQVAFLSATLPPSMMQEFQQRMFLSNPRVVRDITFRSDLQYGVRTQPAPGSFEAWTVSQVRRAWRPLESDPHARAIVYAESRAAVRDIATALGCECYFSDSGSEVDKERVLTRWRDGTHRTVAATSAFGVGVDYPAVRLVFHYGLPTDANNFAQEVGRLGRDGRGGINVVLLPYQWMPVDNATWERERHTTPLVKRVMQRYAASRCLSASLSRYQDGPGQMQYCRAGLVCSVCRVRGPFATSEVDSTLYWDRERPSTTDSKRDQSDDDDDEDDDDDDDDDEEEAVAQSTAMQAGSTRLREAERTAETERVLYLERLDRWNSICWICHLLRGGQGRDHDLDGCRSQHKFAFFDAKKAALGVGGRRAWMRDHTACWQCGQLPTICDGKHPARSCRYRDMVLPATWAMYRMPHLWGMKLSQVSGQLGGFAEETDWMTWLGQECEVFGERGTHGVRTFAWLLAQVDSAV